MLRKKLAELSDEELKEVTGGRDVPVPDPGENSET